MRGSLLVVALTLLCSACAVWQDETPPTPAAIVASRSDVVQPPQRPEPAASSPSSDYAIAPDARPPSSDDPERFVCVDGLRLVVSYSPDRQVARVNTGGARLMSLRRVPQEGYVAYESAAAQFLRQGPRAVFVSAPHSIIVQHGDTLGAIARRLYGDSSRARDIVSANAEALTNPDLIYVGQVLQLPHWRHLCRRTLI